MPAGLVVVAVSTAVALSPTAVTAAPSPLAQACQKAEIPVGLLLHKKTPLIGPDCDLRGKVIRAHPMLAVVVPADNEGVRAHLLLDETVVLNDQPDYLGVDVVEGDVAVAVQEDVGDDAILPDASTDTKTEPDPSPDSVEVKPEGFSTLASVECSQTAYNLKDVYNGYHKWYFAKDTVPSYFNKDLAEKDVRAGAYNIDVGYNDCGLTQSMGTDLAYGGFTFDGADINSDGTCNARDGKNVAAFGYSSSWTRLATACTWTSWRYGPDYIIEGDIEFNNGSNRFFYYLPSGCSDRYELQGVATHEFGHIFGLGHVSEQYYPRMTMSPIATACSYSDKSLGRGDWQGLRKRYGA
ncbi:MAG TPA: matrixin family metalloprotease [Jiangellales bacterium]|nr:matrixin family metalloprotease [Jiangellales bacterium]